MLKKVCFPIMRQARQISMKIPKAKLQVKMDEEMHRMMEAEELKPRKHSGRMSTRVAELPGWLPRALEKALEDSPLTAIIEDGRKLKNFLHSRHPPPEASLLQAKYTDIRMEIASKRAMKEPEDFTKEALGNDEHNKILQMLKRRVPAWAPVQYNKYAGLMYLVSRSAQDYAVLHKICSEIAVRDKEFNPSTLLDFGSGVGTALWVTSQLWPNSIQEHMCVDVSSDMNDLSGIIAGQAEPPVKGLFYRQFLPLSNRTYDLVVNAHSLLELPNMQARLDTISKLWRKTEKYLVIVEQGTNAGFQVVNEARDFILHLKRAREQSNPQAAFVFSPCPHDLRCPRYGARNDKTPCNFETTYRPLPLRNIASPGVERFCYVVLKKGDRSEEKQNWPRIVRPTLIRSKHTICRLCTTKGTLDEIIFTANQHGKWMYRSAKSSQWGDRLPLEILDEPEKVEKSESESEQQLQLQADQ